MKYLLLLPMILIIVFSSCKSDRNSSSDDYKTILLVRHAEKTNQSSDPPLSRAGITRTERLAEMLKEMPISAVFSTDFDRTRSTAQPIAESHGVNVEIYGTSDLTILRGQLEEVELGEMVVVVGHSNTTPVVANLLDAGANYQQIDEYDYENLFIIQIDREGNITSQLTTFDQYETAFSER